MEKEFVKCKVERVNHKGATAVKLNGSTPKLLYDLAPVEIKSSNKIWSTPNLSEEDRDKLKDIFITHKRDSSYYEVCQLTVDDEGYNKIYTIKADTEDEVKTAIDQMTDDLEFGDNHTKYTLANLVYHFIIRTILYNKAVEK